MVRFSISLSSLITSIVSIGPAELDDISSSIIFINIYSFNILTNSNTNKTLVECTGHGFGLSDVARIKDLPGPLGRQQWVAQEQMESPSAEKLGKPPLSSEKEGLTINRKSDKNEKPASRNKEPRVNEKKQKGQCGQEAT